MDFLFAITDKSSCRLGRMRNLLLEMILELETGNSIGLERGGDGPIVFLMLFLKPGKPSVCLLCFPLASDLLPMLSIQLSLSL